MAEEAEKGKWERTSISTAVLFLFGQNVAVGMNLFVAATCQTGAVHQAATQYLFDMIVIRRRRADGA